MYFRAIATNYTASSICNGKLINFFNRRQNFYISIWFYKKVLYASQHPKQVKLGLGVPPGSPIIALREQLQADTGIPSERIILAEIIENGFARVFCDSYPMSSIGENDPIYCIETPDTTAASSENSNLTLVIANIHRQPNNQMKMFSTPFCVQVNRDVSYTDLQKKLLKEMQSVLKPEAFAYGTALSDMFQIRLQDPSADPDTYIEPTVNINFYNSLNIFLSFFF